MPQLVVRKVEEKLVRALKMRAARHGRSAEAEHRELLKQALLNAPEVDFKEFLLRMPDPGTLKRSRKKTRPLKLGDICSS
jgi:antitoxin FitA